MLENLLAAIQTVPYDELLLFRMAIYHDEFKHCFNFLKVLALTINSTLSFIVMMNGALLASSYVKEIEELHSFIPIFFVQIHVNIHRGK